MKDSGYRPREFYERNAALREVLDFIASGALAGGDTNLFRPLVDNLLGHDPFLVLADYQAYVDCQDAGERALARQPEEWTRKSILNDGADGQVLVGPLHPRLLRAGVEGEAGHGGLGRWSRTADAPAMDRQPRVLRREAFARAGVSMEGASSAAWTPLRQPGPGQCGR